MMTELNSFYPARLFELNARCKAAFLNYRAACEAYWESGTTDETWDLANKAYYEWLAASQAYWKAKGEYLKGNTSEPAG